ncbi:hypothetical protein BN59_01006 [Legionella massiliensis]|uniref:Uncharacterized protein n=1 Tax=Legionella massiliensis TaxID=1034943 RepID=A0A078KUL6_9GAMM|nr:hypothetical protein BN59_01006 [Legionella massiliensis]CEE12469.1 hypothetical protein BN1094_01006 [Legionella massiliensis]
MFHSKNSRRLSVPKGVRHVERRETSPECSTVLIPEIPHYVRDDGVKRLGRSVRRPLGTISCYCVRNDVTYCLGENNYL